MDTYFFEAPKHPQVNVVSEPTPEENKIQKLIADDPELSQIAATIATERQRRKRQAIAVMSVFGFCSITIALAIGAVTSAKQAVVQQSQNANSSLAIDLQEAIAAEREAVYQFSSSVLRYDPSGKNAGAVQQSAQALALRYRTQAKKLLRTPDHLCNEIAQTGGTLATCISHNSLEATQLRMQAIQGIRFGLCKLDKKGNCNAKPVEQPSELIVGTTFIRELAYQQAQYNRQFDPDQDTFEFEQKRANINAARSQRLGGENKINAAAEETAIAKSLEKFQNAIRRDRLRSGDSNWDSGGSEE